MKLITIYFDDSVDPSVLPKETAGVTVSDGTNTLTDGTVMFWTDGPDPKPVTHRHGASIGLPTPP